MNGARLCLWEGRIADIVERAQDQSNQQRKAKNLKNMRPARIRTAIPILCLAIALSNPAPLPAIGIRSPDQDASATGRGNAFAATADDPAAVYYNPAGITQLEGANLSLGMYGIEYGSRYSGAGGSVNSQQQWGALPQVFSTLNFTNCHLALGLGVYSPYGLSLEWPNKAPWAASGQSGEVDYYRVNPVIAYQICDTLSIAAGVMLDYSETELKGSAFSLHAHDNDAGFNASVFWHPLQQHSFGVVYRSATDMNYKGHVSFLAPPPIPQPAAQAGALNFHLPQTLVAGYSYRPTADWNLEVDADWTDWSSLRAPMIQTGPIPLGALALNWKPSMMYEFGVTRYLGKGWQASAGYMFSENSVPTSFFNPLIPDSDRHVFSIGVGKTCRHFSWDAAYQLGYGPARSVTENYNPNANGSYEFFSNALSISLGWHF